MVRFRPRQRRVYSGFTTPEIEKMEKFYKEYGEQSLDKDFCKRLAKQFSCSQGRVGKPRVKFAVQSWFRNKQQSDQSDNILSATDQEQEQLVGDKTRPIKDSESPQVSKANDQEQLVDDKTRPIKDNESPQVSKANDQEQLVDDKTRPIKDNESPQVSKANDQEQLVDDKTRSIKDNESPQVSKVPEAGERVPDISKWEYEARSSKDKAWYDVEGFVDRRYLRPDELEVRVRLVGFGAGDDEWIRFGRDIRLRSIPLENSDCEKVQAGDLEREDQAKYYDAYIVDIIRRMHDVRGCRCLFTIRYDHNNLRDRVHSSRLCLRPYWMFRDGRQNTLFWNRDHSLCMQV